MKEGKDVYLCGSIEYTLDGANAFTVL